MISNWRDALACVLALNIGSHYSLQVFPGGRVALR
jgi:hypothetical protein